MRFQFLRTKPDISWSLKQKKVEFLLFKSFEKIIITNESEFPVLSLLKMTIRSKRRMIQSLLKIHTKNVQKQLFERK